MSMGNIDPRAIKKVVRSIGYPASQEKIVSVLKQANVGYLAEHVKARNYNSAEEVETELEGEGINLPGGSVSPWSPSGLHV